MPSKDFHALLDTIRRIHDKKNQDYADEYNPFSNFEEAAEHADCSVIMVFRVIQGIKIARIKQLENSGRAPNNESLRDSKLDLAIYQLLEISYEDFLLNQTIQEMIVECTP